MRNLLILLAGSCDPPAVATGVETRRADVGRLTSRNAVFRCLVEAWRTKGDNGAIKTARRRLFASEPASYLPRPVIESGGWETANSLHRAPVQCEALHRDPNSSERLPAPIKCRLPLVARDGSLEHATLLAIPFIDSYLCPRGSLVA